MRRSTTGEAVEALLSGTAIAPAKGNDTVAKKGQVEVATAQEETAATIAAAAAPAQRVAAPVETAQEPVAAPVNTVSAPINNLAAPISEPISLPSRKKFEETHTRSTFYVENELLDILNSFAVEKGQKTFIINEALRRFLAVIQQS